MTTLSVEEYMLLALHASAAGEHHACMSYLQAVLQLEPDNGKAVYLLAMQHTELGLFERGLSGLKAALSLDASLETARFQLGLMLLERKRSVEAKPHFEQLTLSQDVALRVCSTAMLALTDNDPLTAQRWLRQGLELTSSNYPLVALMRRLVQKLTKDAARFSGEGGHSLLGAYRPASS